MEGLTDYIKTTGTLVIEGKNVQFDLERVGGQLPTHINANHYDSENQQGVNVTLDVATGKFHYSVNNTDVTGIESALIQGVLSKIDAIRAELEAEVIPEPIPEV